MQTYLVWVLLLYSNYNTRIAVVDNIASYKECAILANAMRPAAFLLLAVAKRGDVAQIVRRCQTAALLIANAS